MYPVRVGTHLFRLCPQSLRRVGKDTTVLLICVTVFLSYLPEAGQYSSFFLYLRQVRHTHTYLYLASCDDYILDTVLSLARWFSNCSSPSHSWYGTESYFE